MTKVDIFSGFLGAGKTTLIKKLINEAYKGEQVVLIENEFGEIGIDGGFLKDSGIQINEMNSGCICCSLVGDFGDALKKVLDEFHPDRIIIEPSGVGKLSDIINAVENLDLSDVKLNGFTTVVDAKKAKIYMKNFGEFYNNQVEHASSIILSHTKDLDEEKLKNVVSLLREKNEHAVIVTTDWDMIDGKKILDAMENKDTIEEALKHLTEEHEMDHECCCHHDHEHDEECCHHDHHDHDHDHEHEHEHHHHHHHHADEVFDSIGIETTKKFNIDKLKDALSNLQDSLTYGQVLRAKGIVESDDGQWIHFDYVPGESDVRYGTSEVTGRLCVIGAKIDEEALRELFEI